MRHENPADVLGEKQSRTVTQGWGVAFDASQSEIPAAVGEKRSVEPKLSRPFRHFKLNSIVASLDRCNARLPTTTVSGSGCGIAGMTVSETYRMAGCVIQ